MTKYPKKIKKNSGAAMLIFVVFFLFISLSIVLGLIVPSVREFKNATVNLNSKKSYFLAESGVEDALFRILNNQTISATESLALDGNAASTTITNLVGNSKQIVSVGDVSSYKRKDTVVLKAGDGAVFKYGTQAGQGGFEFKNNSYVTGNIYSNGNIIGSNGAYLTGDAFVAGSTGLISNMRVGFSGVGSAHVHTITGSTVTGTIYCQIGSGNNKACNTSEEDPPEEDLPISEDDITQWETDATAGGTTVGNVTISTPTTMGPRKIVGDLTINSTLTIADTIYVTGTITITGTVKLNASYGATSGIIIADGVIDIGNGVVFTDSGTAGSYIMLLSNSTCDSSVTISPCFSKSAIEVNNNSTISIVNAQKGTVSFSNNAQVKESVGNKVELRNNVHISYGTGVISVGFTSGPSGSWVIDSWVESR